MNKDKRQGWFSAEFTTARDWVCPSISLMSARPNHNVRQNMRLRIPFTAPLPSPARILPASAATVEGAVAALASFLDRHGPKTLLISGAGISVASGLPDYRGVGGSYVRNNGAYRPVFLHEFCATHAARQRYWARSFLGWPAVARARPNAAHAAVAQLQRMGLLCGGAVTQNVDSLHSKAASNIARDGGADSNGDGDRGGEVLELHGALRTVICLHCGERTPRAAMQQRLAELNPAWHALLQRAQRGGPDAAPTNPDGDVAMPGVDYVSFRYPPCAACAARDLLADADGAFAPPPPPLGALTGVLKPNITFFGESVDERVRARAGELAADASAVLVVGSTLATYSAWRLVRDAHRAGKGLAIVNLGGVRDEAAFFANPAATAHRVRVDLDAAPVLAGVVRALGGSMPAPQSPADYS